jgi:hypothetical protein
MQKHSRACHLRGAQIRFERVQAPLAIVIFGCVQLHASSVLLSLVKLNWVTDWTHDQVTQPNESKEATCKAKENHRDQCKPVLVIAVPILVNRVEGLALCACIGAIIIELGAVFNHWTTARVLATDDVRDWTSWIQFCAH